jgi:NADPH:quinone reductase-like Zn-dependent oxidoreductase
MRAAVHRSYGPPYVVSIRDVPKPVPKKNEVLVKVLASTVNRTDCGFRLGKPYAVRLFAGLSKPRHPIWGNEFAGIIEEVGSEVTEFRVGDQVFGIDQNRFGTHAEYKCIREDRPITIKPSNLSFEESVAILEGPWLAVNYLKRINIGKQHSLLVNGASGSIGSSGIQLAKHFGARITAVTDTKSLNLARSLGADEVIDYTKENFTSVNNQFDLIFDAVGKSSFTHCKKILKPGAIYFSTEPGPGWENIFMAIWTSMFGKQKVIFPIPRDSKEEIIFFKPLAEAGEIRPVIDRDYPLEMIVEAYQYVETGKKIGTVVINMI